jgi:hypothetical protein
LRLGDARRPGPVRHESGELLARGHAPGPECVWLPPLEVVVDIVASPHSGSGPECTGMTTTSPDNYKVSFRNTCPEGPVTIDGTGTINWNQDGTSATGLETVTLRMGANVCATTNRLTYAKL